MSTAARKARKREDFTFTHNADGSRRPRRAKGLKLLRDAFWYDRRHKEGTPFHERAAVQPRPIFGKGKDNPATRHGITSRAAHGLISRGYTLSQLEDLGFSGRI
jgi:hypothetical protein